MTLVKRQCSGHSYLNGSNLPALKLLKLWYWLSWLMYEEQTIPSPSKPSFLLDDSLTDSTVIQSSSTILTAISISSSAHLPMDLFWGVVIFARDIFEHLWQIYVKMWWNNLEIHSETCEQKQKCKRKCFYLLGFTKLIHPNLNILKFSHSKFWMKILLFM